MVDFKCKIKYLYRRLDLVCEEHGVCRIDYVRYDEVGRHYFSDDFPNLYRYMLCSQSITVRHLNGITLHIYKDKYKNIIVRYYETPRKVRV